MTGSLFRKFASFSAAVLMLLPAGCLKMKSSSSAEEEREFAPIPAAGWNTSALLEVSSLGGEMLSYPLSASVLGSDFSLDKKNQSVSENGTICVPLSYKDKKLGTLLFPENTRKIKSSTECCGISVTLREGQPDEPITVNGIGFGDKKDDVIKALGEPDTDNDDTLIYNSEHGGERLVMFHITEKNGVDAVVINILPDNGDTDDN